MEPDPTRARRRTNRVPLTWAGVGGWLDWGLAALSIVGGCRAFISNRREEGLLAFGVAALYAALGTLVFSAMDQMPPIPGRKPMLIISILIFSVLGVVVMSMESIPYGALFLGLAMAHYQALQATG